ncbi:uncharacterized protein EV422DRAFT_581398 [Fimicolochytrium jonesii]|uniref:uncharacterized protein n=1 Tax=Fimicolochytrium jonesii TaxID=1396493 RepID=UPI0022FDF009|nr:uncharacterized protein EV422DRAFT_581398 [Fimicolochytrium jonesii]KAI8816503.1 hypothetical protein EV422DRAFT_581398 [Fimicolochytrium jonesii]
MPTDTATPLCSPEDMAKLHNALNPGDRATFLQIVRYLRDYQRDDVYRFLRHCFLPSKPGHPPPAGIERPTATGKSWTLAAIAIYFQFRGLKTAVIQPNITLRSQIYEKFIEIRDRLVKDRRAWNASGLRTLSSEPANATNLESLQDPNATQRLQNCTILIGNYHRFAGVTRAMMENCGFIPDLVIMDEAHHAAASTYINFIQEFSHDTCHFLFISARLTRHDGQTIECEIISSWSLKWADKYRDAKGRRIIKHPVHICLEVDDLQIEVEQILDGVVQEPEYEVYTAAELDDPDLSSDARRALTTLPAFWHVAKRMVEALKANRALKGTHHQFLGTAANTDHAQLVSGPMKTFEVPDELGNPRSVKSSYVSSRDHSVTTNEDILKSFGGGELDGLAHIFKLTEGYDNKYISVIGFFCGMTSVNQVEQIIGRALRPLPNDEDNIAYIITLKPFKMTKVLKKLGIRTEHERTGQPTKGKKKAKKNKKKTGQHTSGTEFVKNEKIVTMHLMKMTGASDVAAALGAPGSAADDNLAMTCDVRPDRHPTKRKRTGKKSKKGTDDMAKKIQQQMTDLQCFTVQRMKAMEIDLAACREDGDSSSSDDSSESSEEDDG